MNRKANNVCTLDFIVPSIISFIVTTLGFKKEEKLEYHQLDSSVKLVLLYYVVILVMPSTFISDFLVYFCR